MSAIAGLVDAAGQGVDPAAVQRMLDAMPGRAPDRSRLFHGAVAVLGRTARDPSAGDRSGAALCAAGDLAVTADVRLDNRADLVAALRVGDEQSDAGLILAAYERWGDECPARLLGDFAFALWDDRRGRLFCARDHFGVKPLYYGVAGGRFAFASEIKALLTIAPRSVSEVRIAEFLVGLPPEGPATLFEGIFSLPPAHSVTVAGTVTRLSRYWQLEGSTPAGKDYPEQFRAIFASAVECRLRSDGPVGAMLSGGLDSSAIACVAAPLVARSGGRALPTFSTVFDETPAASERPHVDSVLALGSFTPTFIAAEEVGPFDDFDDILAEQDGPFLAPGLATSRLLYRAAADAGVRVLLDGHGGDEVVSSGEGRLAELARAGRWFGLWREVRGLAASYGEPAWPVFAAHLEHYGPRALRPARKLAGRALRRLGRARVAEARPGPLSFVEAGFARRTGIAARCREKTVTPPAARGDERQRHIRLLSSPLIPSAFGVLDKAARSARVEARYPFFDRRLVDFCVGLPASEKLSGGWPRLILRRAMQGVLPPSIQWRRDKLDFAPLFARGMVKRHAALVDHVLRDDRAGVGHYVDVAAVSASFQRMKQETATGLDIQIVWRTAALSLWLRRLERGAPDAPVISVAS